MKSLFALAFKHTPAFALYIAVSSIAAAQNAAPNAAPNAPLNAAPNGTAKSPTTSSYISDSGSYSGDSLTLGVSVTGFKEVNVDNGPSKCAPANSRLNITNDRNDVLSVTFKDPIPVDHSGHCDPANSVTVYTEYTIEKAKIEQYAFKREGVIFGGLVVPFKFRLGSTNELVSSSTIAPYVGYKLTSIFGYGASFTPILSAGLGLVPVANSANNTTSSKAAFSLALGLLLGSSKNQNYTAGLVFGRDFLSRADRQIDSSVNRAWLSFWVGYAP
jgi:hypothetical protein